MFNDSEAETGRPPGGKHRGQSTVTTKEWQVGHVDDDDGEEEEEEDFAHSAHSRQNKRLTEL